MVSDGSKGEEMVTRGYMALHQSRECHEPIIYDPGLISSDFFRKNLEMASLVRLALDHDLFVPFYQPIYENFPTNEPTCKVECLTRMIHPSDRVSVVAAGKFLDAVKKGGHMRELTSIMIDKTFAALKNTSVQFSINLSEEDVTNPNFCRYVKAKFAEYGIDPRRVTFEILENIDTLKADQAIVTARELKSYGCKIAIDDFGTENANLTRMIDFAADYIKIDIRYVRDIDTNAKNESLLRHIIGYAHENGIKVVAEGVETESEQRALMRLGVDYSQGYLFSRPSQNPYPV